jgi:hypothetical protein
MYNGAPLYKDEANSCANHSLPEVQCPRRPLPPPPSPTTPTTTEPTTVVTTAAPTPDPCTACEGKKCNKCDFRNSANGKTFVRNVDYMFAAKATFVSITTHKCRKALNFTLNVQYPLKSVTDCTEAPPIPSSFLLLGKHEDCEEADSCFLNHETLKNSGETLVPGQAYLIAGSYSTEEGCDTLWEVTTKTLIAKWVNKLESKIDSFINKGNEARC